MVDRVHSVNLLLHYSVTITARKIAFTGHQMCGQRFCKGHLCTLLMIFDAHQRSSLNAPLPPRSKAAKAAFTHLWRPVKGASKVSLWYAFACCQKRVKGVSKFVCDSSQWFVKDVVEDTCDAGQRFVKGALCGPPSHVSAELLARAPHSRLATVRRVSHDPHLLRFFSCLLHRLCSSVYERCNHFRTLVLCLTSLEGIYQL